MSRNSRHMVRKTDASIAVHCSCSNRAFDHVTPGSWADGFSKLSLRMKKLKSDFSFWTTCRISFFLFLGQCWFLWLRFMNLQTTSQKKTTGQKQLFLRSRIGLLTQEGEVRFKSLFAKWNSRHYFIFSLYANQIKTTITNNIFFLSFPAIYSFYALVWTRIGLEAVTSVTYNPNSKRLWTQNAICKPIFYWQQSWENIKCWKWDILLFRFWWQKLI